MESASGTYVAGSILNRLKNGAEGLFLEPPALTAIDPGQRRNQFMAYERNPDDPYRFSNRPDDEYRRAARLDNELQPDPELAEGRAGGGRVALFAIAIAVVLGAVFYGLNSSSVHQAGTSTAQNTQSSPPAAPPGIRDVTPHANTDQGMTTGAAPARPQNSPPTAPAQMNRPANPADSTAPSK
jgi:hypothetical protein